MQQRSQHRATLGTNVRWQRPWSKFSHSNALIGTQIAQISAITILGCETAAWLAGWGLACGRRISWHFRFRGDSGWLQIRPSREFCPRVRDDQRQSRMDAP
jgi:hypothetical protein